MVGIEYHLTMGGYKLYEHGGGFQISI